MKKNLLALVVGAGISIAGCMQIPLAGEFPNERINVAVPHHPVVMALAAGQYECKKIGESDIKGIGITKYHWIAGETGHQDLYAPNGVTGVGIKDSPNFLFEHDFWIGYDLEGKRYVEQYGVGWDGKKSRLKEKYLYNGEKKNLINVKDIKK